jgi:hypothetical protein
MALEKGFINGDILYADDSLSQFQLHDAIDQEKWVSMR